MSSIVFYEALPTLKRFEDTMKPANYTSLPDDWYIAITDVKNSTIAIEEGRYKEVNAMGAVSIMAMLNVTGKYNFPFVFGGDGSTIGVPPELYAKVISGLKGVQELARDSFGLDLRAAVVPLTDIKSAGFDIKVAKYAVSSYYQQATFLGGGATYAENLIKDPINGAKYQVEELEGDPEIDVSGLECRWDEVKNSRGEVHSLLVESTSEDPVKKFRLYQEVFQKIGSIYGSDEEFAPITTDGLSLTLDNKKLAVERKVQTFGKEWRDKIKYWIKLRIQWLFGIILMGFGIKTENVDWGIYKRDLAENTDYRKFDDILRLVLAGSETQRYTLQGYLETLYENGQLVYGLHHANSALITCVILNHHQGHIHLVDGSDGGYAKAATKMKARKKRELVVD
jgi:hypothetical protein